MKLKVTAKQIAQLINGKIEGDEKVVVSRMAKIEKGEEEAISFIADDKFHDFIYTDRKSVV